MRIGIGLAVGAAVAALGACGGDGESNGGGAGGSDASAGAGGGGAGGASGGSGGASGGSGGAIGGSGGSGATGGKSQNWDGGVGIACGAATCTAGTEICCGEVDADGGSPTCVGEAACQSPFVIKACDGPEDCAGKPGTFCCSVGNGTDCREANECHNPVCRTEEDCKSFYPGAVDCLGEDPFIPKHCVPIV